MGWIVIRAGGSLTDGEEATFSRDVPTGADELEHQRAYEDAHAFIDGLKPKREVYIGLHDKEPGAVSSST